MHACMHAYIHIHINYNMSEIHLCKSTVEKKSNFVRNIETKSTITKRKQLDQYAPNIYVAKVRYMVRYKIIYVGVSGHVWWPGI